MGLWHTASVRLLCPALRAQVTFPEVAYLLLGIVTKYDNVAEMYLIQVCLLVTLVVLLLAFRANNKSSLGLFLFVPVSLLIFSFRQEANMLFGYQLNFAFVVAFGVLTLFLLYVLGHTRFKKTAFAVALVSATVATYSIVPGLLVWPVGLLQLFLSPLEKPKKRNLLILWGLVGLFVWITYLRDWTPGRNPSSFIDWSGTPGTEPGDWSVTSTIEDESSSGSGELILYALQHPLEGVEFFLSLLGSSLFWPQQRTFDGGLLGLNLGSVTGLLLVCIALVSLVLVYKDRRLGQHSFWISLMLYSFLILAAITVGRFESGLETALAPRYTTFSVLAIVSIYGLLATVALRRRLSIRRPNISTIFLILLSGTVVLSAATISYPKGIKAGRHDKAITEKAAFILATYETQPDELIGETSGITQRLGARVVRERAPVLQELGYNVFSEPQAQQGFLPPLSALSPVVSSTLLGGIDTLSTDTESNLLGTRLQNRSVVISQEASFIKLEGWALDTSNESTAGGVYIDIDGELFPTFYGTARRDVRRYFKSEAYRYSGFERAIPLSEIGVGSHELSVVILTPDRKGYYRHDQKLALEIK